MNTYKPRYLAILMWFLPLSFFTYQFILRLWPSLMMKQMMSQFSIDATAFGFLASFYYYGYAGLQIPIAFMLERYKPSNVIAACVFICGVSTYVFSTTDSWYLACLTRFLIGASSGGAFIGTSKVISEWFPKKDYAKMVGWSFSIGLMGAIYGGKPVNLLLEAYGAEKVVLWLTIVAIIISLLVFLLLTRPRKEDTIKPHDPFKVKDFKGILLMPSIWLLGIANLFMVGLLEGYTDVWGVNHLVTAYGLAKSEAAELTSFIFVGMLFGGPILAFLSQNFGHCKVIALCGLLMAGLFCIVLTVPAYNWYLLAVIFFALGIMCCYQVLVFALGADIVPDKLQGVSVAFLNCINMLGGSFFHLIIGYRMDQYWTGTLSGDIRQYSLESYYGALVVIPICAIIGGGIVWLVGSKIKYNKTNIS